MAISVNSLQLAAWTPAASFNALSLTCFTMPMSAHQVLLQWQRLQSRSAKTWPSQALKGLDEVLAVLVPDLAMVRRNKIDGYLQLYFLNDRTQDNTLRDAVFSALSLWLGILYDKQPGSARAEIAASAQHNENWHIIDVSLATEQHADACAMAKDTLAFDALVSYANHILGGKTLAFRSGETRTFVPVTAHSSSLFYGLELVAFPPSQDSVKKNCYWSEAISLTTATFPEREGIHLLARPSIRNWGPVDYPSSYGGNARSMDMFIPDEAGNYRHTSLKYYAQQDKHSSHKSIEARWKHKQDARILALINRLTGSKHHEQSECIVPIIQDQSIWLLPRLSHGAGDRFFAGGTGVGWPDRMDITHSLNQHLEQAGFCQTGTMQRVTKRKRLNKPFRENNASQLRRQRVLDTLNHLETGLQQLTLYLFQRQENTRSVVMNELITLLGQPENSTNTQLRWPDGLCINLVSLAAGPLSEQLPTAELNEEEKTGRTPSQIKQILNDRQKTLNRQTEQTMMQYIGSVLDTSGSVACAVLEMNSSLRGKACDPYVFSRRALAKHHILPQVILIEETMPAEKYTMAVRDCLRMLGVVPAGLNDTDPAPAALTVIQQNRHITAGQTMPAITLPLAARVVNHCLECALPQADGTPQWQPYATALLTVLTGKFEPFSRTEADNNNKRFERFFEQALQQIDKNGPNLVQTNVSHIGQQWASLTNNKLAFDKLQLLNQTVTSSQLPNTRLVRLNRDEHRIPLHFHKGEQLDVSGLFDWEAASRTFYGLKVPAQTMIPHKHNAGLSRHDNGEHKYSARNIRQLVRPEEICVVFCQPQDEPQTLALYTHRLRQLHVQYNEDTNQPFPLHELDAIGKGLSF